MVFVVKYLHDAYTFYIIINNFIIHNLFQDPLASLDLVDFDETPDPEGKFTGYGLF